jgi:hypothetical protein
MTRKTKNNPHIKSISRGIKLLTLIIKAVIPLLLGRNCELSKIFCCYQRYSESLLKEITNRGPKFAAQQFKQYKRIAQAVALKTSFDPIPWTSSNKKGIPKVLMPLVPLLNGGDNEKRIGLTICNIVSLIHLKPELDLGAIMDPGPSLDEAFSLDFQSFLKGLKYLPKEPYTIESNDITTSSFFSSKMGPNGQAVINSHLDALALSKNENVMWAVMRMLKVSNPELARLLSKMIDIFQDVKIEGDLHLSKIAMIAEGGGKTRNIAILDFFSQNALKPIHSRVMNLLKTIPSDATYNQEDGFKRGMRLANLSGYCASYDLSSATDRFPLQLQVDVVRCLFGSLVAKDWSCILRDRDFYEPSSKMSGIRWARGQPLGALSSWGVFTLTHHSIVRYCAKDVNFENYQILGDDIMIFDPVVSKEYLRVMTECLSVKINTQKSYVASAKPVFGEFAKRIFIADREISGIPIDMLLSAAKSIYLIPELLAFMTRRYDTTFPGAELYTPEFFSYLSVKGKFHLSVFLGFKQTLGAQMGYPWCMLGKTPDAIKNLYLEYHLTRLEGKVQKLWKDSLKSRDRNLEKWVHSVKSLRGGPASELVSSCIRQRLHPIYYMSKSLIEGFYAQQQLILDIKDGIIDITDLEKRFVVDTSMRPIFEDIKILREKSQGSASLQMYYRCINELGVRNK